MSESLKTTELHDLVDRIQAGDREAADALIRRSSDRLEDLAHKMLKGFPRVGRWEETGDVFNTAAARLLNTLEKVTPDSVAGFFRLAAQAVRRALLDLARHYSGAMNHAAHHDSVPDGPPATSHWATRPKEVRNLERWAAFHEAVERLPDDDRELFELGYYEGLSKEEMARLYQVDEKTIRRRWNKATRRLAEAVGDEIPT